MEKIKIFLALGEDGLIDEKNQIGNFIRNLNDIYEDYDIYFRLVTNEQLGDTEEEKIKDSQLFFLLFEKSINEKAISEFNMAYKNFINDKSPKIATYIKKNDAGVEQNAYEFMKRLDEELGHYYNQYENVDTVKLNIIMQLQALGIKEVKMEIKEGKLYLNKKEIMTLENIPMIFNNQQLKQLKLEYSMLEKKYWKLREDIKENPDNDEILEEYIKIKDRREKTRETIENLEKEIINLENSFIQTSSKGILSQKQIYAKRCLENGDIEGAKQALELEEIKKEADKLLSTQQNIKDNIQIKVNELLQRADILKIDIDNINRFEEIEETYKEAMRIEKEASLYRIALKKYIVYLYSKCKYKEASELCDVLYNYLKGEGLSIDAEIYNRIAMCYAQVKKYEEAKKYYWIAIEEQEKIAKEDSETDKEELADFYNNVAKVLSDTGKIEEAESYYRKEIEIREKLASKNPEKYQLNLVEFYINLASFYYEIGRKQKAKEFYIESVSIIEKCIENGVKNAETYLAVSCRELAYIYYKAKQFEIAEEYFIKSIELYEELTKKNPEAFEKGLVKSYVGISFVYYQIHEYDKAESYCLESLKIIRRMEKEKSENYEEMKNVIYKILLTGYQAKNDREKVREIKAKMAKKKWFFWGKK